MIALILAATTAMGGVQASEKEPTYRLVVEVANV